MSQDEGRKRESARLGVARWLVDLRPRTVAMAVAVTLSVIVAVAVAYYTRRLLIWLAIAFFLSLALNHLVAPLSRRLPRGVASVGVFVGVLASVGGIGYVLVPPIVEEVRSLVIELPELVRRLSEGRGPLGPLQREFDIVGRLERVVAERGAAGVTGLTQPLVSVLSSVVTTVVGIVAIAFLTLFMLIEGPAWQERFLNAVPPAQRRLWERVSDGVYRAIGGWIIGAVALSAVAGVSAGLVLFLLGAPFPVALALVVAVLDPIPFVGATAAATIVSLILLASQGFWPALAFLAFVLVYQNVVENHILIPIVYGHTVQLSALVVLVAVLAGAELAGIVGALIAIPVAGTIKVVGSEVLEWRRTGRIIEPPAAAEHGGEAERAPDEQVARRP